MWQVHTEGDIMEEYTGSCRPRPPYTERFHRLTDVHRCFLAGSLPHQTATDVADLIFRGVCGPVTGEDRERAPAERCHENAVEVTCISMTVVDNMCCLVSRSHTSQITVYCGEIMGLLFEHMDLMSQLVHHFQNQEQIISHLAAKSVSAYVVYHLHKSGTVSPVWQQKCAQSFDSSPPGHGLDACLWSLTEVLKRLLKRPHPEILRKLLAAFDSSVCALCSKYLPDDSGEAAPCLVDLKSSRHWGTTCCLLLDLLEALTASSLICDAGLTSQRLTHIHSSALLTTVSQCSSEYFVKKRVLLLLKRAVLQKAGEDWVLGDMPCTRLKHEHFSSDVNLLAQKVLTAVAANWLETVQVESSSFFGGTRCIQGVDGQKPDCVILRAVSLLLLKSMELHIQTAEIKVDRAIKVSGILESLWSFLRRCHVQLKEVTHLCSWVSLLFGEQDDDMMEAAKALLSIFLHHRLSSGMHDDVTVSGEACASGCNPHCHFLFLLQSISFNHSILLDFLISTETCFLEYFVRYLKYLRTDWQSFTAACERISMSHCPVSQLGTLSCSRAGDTSALTYKAEPDRVKSSSSVQPTAVIPPVDRTSSVSGLRLVEYDSSDESESESMEICEDEPGAGGASVFTRQKCESSDSAGLLSEPQSVLEGGPGAVLQNKETSHTSMAPAPGQVTCETFLRAVLCLSELREVVTRLQRKKLFPYNPSSLLKLLAQVELPAITSVTVQ